MSVLYIYTTDRQWRIESQSLGHMDSTEPEPITGVWVQSPQRALGEEPLITESGRSP